MMDPGDWYRDLPVTLHFDNHGGLLGKGETVESLTAKLRGLPIGLLQVSARSGYCTYPTRFGVTKPGAEEWDTPAVWRQVAKNLGVRFGIYVNVLGDEILSTNPQWKRADANGKLSDRSCLRPSLDGSGYLERIQIPMIGEVVERYHPDLLWFDGDWSMPLVDYCAFCKQAWRSETGEDEPPVDSKDPRWARWVALEDRRADQYKEKLAAAIHRADPKCLYVSNWSWAISHRDPRQAPHWAGVLSGDVGAGESKGSLFDLRFSAMFLSAQEHTPYDMMSAIYPKPIRSLARMLQEGGLTMACGATWFLWLNQITEPQLDHARTCSALITDRRDALVRTHSANPVAVVLSETTWKEMRAKGGFDWKSPRELAFALQDKGYCVDVVNEATLAERRNQYKAVVSSLDQIKIPPTVKLEPAPGNPHVVFALRTKGRATILHVTDLTSSVKGERIEPNSRSDIDANQTIPELRLSFEMLKKPRIVRVVPASVKLAQQWKDGRLSVTLENVKIHAAIIAEP